MSEFPANNSATGAEVEPKGTADKIYDLLSQVEDEKETREGDKKTKIPEPSSDDVKNEGEEDEEEEVSEDAESDEDESETEEETEVEEEEDEEFEDQIRNAAGLTYNKVKEKYPDIFKKLPQLKSVIFQHGAYSDIFSSVHAAKEAAEKNEIFDQIDDAITNHGDLTPILQGLYNKDKREGTGTFTRLAQNFLPSLHELDPKAFKAATQPLLVTILSNARERSKSTGNKDLRIASEIITEFIFGTRELPTRDGRTDPSLEAKKKELDEREVSIATQEYERNATELLSQIDKRLTKEISKRIDPENALSDFDREAKINKIIDDLNDELTSNDKHRQVMGNLRSRLIKSRYAQEEKARFIGTYLASARTVLGPLLRRAGTAKVSRNDGRKVVPSSSKAGKTFNGKLPSADSLRKSGASILDILNATDKTT